MSVPAANCERCLTTAPARTTQPAPSTLPSQTIAPGSTTERAPMRQPWIMAPGPTITPSSRMRSLSGSRCRTVFSRICTSSPMRTGPWESPMILTPAPMIVRSPTTTSPVISARREQDRRPGDGRHDASVRVELAHGDGLLVCFDGDRRRRREGEVAVAQARGGERGRRPRRSGRPAPAGRPRPRRSGNVIPAGTSVPSPRKTRSPSRAPGMSIEAFPISHRSPTVAPTTMQRWPNVVRRPIVVGISLLPTTTEFSSTADPVPISTPASLGDGSRRLSAS